MTVEEILAALQEIMDAAAADNDRPLTDEEAERYEELEGQLQGVQRSDQIRARHAAWTAPNTSNLQALYGTGVQPDDHGADVLERAFDDYMRTGAENDDIAELRAQSSGTGSAGGFTVPETFRQKLTERLVRFGGLASEAETMTTSTGEDVRWPSIDDTANEGVTVDEGTAPTSGGADLAFGEVTLGAHSYQAPGANNEPLKVSLELLQDSAFNIQDLVARKLGQRISRAQAKHWVNGTGVKQPDGITAASGPSASFAGAAPTYEELVDAKHSIDPDYREGAVWAFNDAMLATLEKMTDADGRPLLINAAAAGLADEPGLTLLGHRIVVDQGFTTYTDASSNIWGVFGNIREAYIIRRVRDMQLIANPYSSARTRQVEYTLWARADGTVQNSYAVATLTNDAAA